MELLYLRAHAGGYRGCAIDDQSYFFFQCNRKDRIRRLLSYPIADFEDRDHFIAMMQKFVSPPVFLQPTIKIDALTLAELERAYRQMMS